jgi:tetratricopeptide (TPR) repeat protein
MEAAAKIIKRAMARKFIYATLSLLLLTAVAIAAQDETDGMIVQYQARVAHFPNVANYDGLGAAYLQKGRETSDLSYFAMAEQSLSKALDLTSSWDVEAASPLTHMAAVCMAEHRFADAASYAKQAIAAGAGDPSPSALLGDAYTDMGDYELAQAYSKLRSADPFAEDSGRTYMYDTRISYLKLLHGDDAAAVSLMQQAVQLALHTHMPSENIAWTYYQLGEDFYHCGDLDNAAKSYSEALLYYPGYYRGLGGLAKVRISQQRYNEGIALYQQAIATIPLIEYVAALADVYQTLGRQQDFDKQYKLLEFIGYLSALNERTYNRELAGFYADHNLKLPQALELAKKELDNRNDVYTRDIYAWCLYKNGKLQDASKAVDSALSLGTKDALMLYHAGIIYRDLGDTRRAEDALRSALAINPQFHPLYSKVAAQTLQGLREQRETIARGQHE